MRLGLIGGQFHVEPVTAAMVLLCVGQVAVAEGDADAQVFDRRLAVAGQADQVPVAAGLPIGARGVIGVVPVLPLLHDPAHAAEGLPGAGLRLGSIV